MLQETFFQAPTPNGASERRHGGYRLVGVVRHNTFDDRPLIARKHIGIIATNANMPPEKVGLALQAPVENQDLLRIQRHEGPREYAVVEERSVKAVLANELARDHPAPNVLAGCRSLLDGLREGS